MDKDAWPRIAVMGAGAVGCYFGGMLARAGAPVTLIGRPLHVDAIQSNGLYLDSAHFRGSIRVAAATDPRAARDAEVVLLSVKTIDTEHAAAALAPHLALGALVLSLQNGVENVERVRAAAGIEAVAGAVYVAVAMTAPGCVKHSGRGDLTIGRFRETPLLSGGERRGEGTCATHPRDADAPLHELAAVFERAGVPCRVSDNIEGELWAKMIINCAYNAKSALGRAEYGRLVGHPRVRIVMTQVIEEAVAVARAAGVRLPEEDMVAAGFRLAESMPAARSSTAQDLARGKRTEIDAFNGYIARRGAELGVATPVNQTLHALVKLLEDVVAEPPTERGPQHGGGGLRVT
jgi:2-dehydropantoate 2-reductase